MQLTPAQKRVYRFIENFMRANGYSPSYEEIRKHLGFRSLNSVSKHLKQLEKRGYVSSPWSNRKRALDLLSLDARSRTASIPFLGVVAAGTPIEAVEVPETVEVPESFLGDGSNFALRVRGDSMIDDGIREGDVLIVARSPQVENGQTAVVLVGGEATVKKFYRHGDRVELRPANTDMDPIHVSSGEVEIIGTVIGLLRHYRKRL